MSAKTQQRKERIKKSAGSHTEGWKLERTGRADRQTGEAAERLAQAARKVNEMIDKAAVAVSRRGSNRRGRAARR